MTAAPTSTLLPSRRSLLLAGFFLLLLAACWSGTLERIARGEADAALNRVVVAFALARTLNGAISVAQGTDCPAAGRRWRDAHGR